jgi:pimeloyl-ACP methyl ester carboxylesterase
VNEVRRRAAERQLWASVGVEPNEHRLQLGRAEANVRIQEVGNGPAVAAIDTPTSFLWGDDDPFGGSDIARAFVALLPDAELELMPGAGHAVWMDDPENAAVTVRQFLGS